MMLFVEILAVPERISIPTEFEFMIFFVIVLVEPDNLMPSFVFELILFPSIV